jgi:EAL domain-containing protein (putative c-di-GMP-specific phosphodiesterase class I)
MYAAKSEGKDRAVAYEHSIAASDALVAAIAYGLEHGELELYYQPLIHLASGAAVGFEALMRWNRPGHGLVPPNDFIPAAEATPLIVDLGRWALREAACQLATWARDGLDPDGLMRVAVNISGRHINSPAIVTDVQAALDAAGITPGRLEVELTETALVDNGLAHKHLALVRGLGVEVAIDDFGTGYTSVGQLPHLPADTLKIDRSFVDSTDPRQRGLVALMVEAAHTFGLVVVAEGVEDTETLSYLRHLGCDQAQGYLMSRPLPAPMVPAWLAAWQAEARHELLPGAAAPVTA